MNELLFSKILYATDLSETAKKAARYALNLASNYGAQLTAINIVPDRVEELSAEMNYDLTGHYPQEILESFNNEGLKASVKAIAERIQDVCTAAGYQRQEDCSIIVKVGEPVDQIVKTAIEGGFDLVVLGTHGHGVLEDLFLGSVARKVVKKCPVPVLTVRL